MDMELFSGGMTIFIVLITCVSIFVPLAITGGVFWFIAKNRQATNKLLTTGLPGQATIVAMGDTGMRINNQPRLQLTLDVQPLAAPGQPPPFQPFRTDTQITVPMMAMARVAPGTVVPVKCDPQNPASLTIDWASMGFMV